MGILKLCWKVLKSVLIIMLFTVIILLIFVLPCGFLYIQVLKIMNSDMMKLIFSMVYYICFVVLLTKSGKFILKRYFFKDQSVNKST